MRKNAMPVSKAKTAYGLLSEIRKLILDEPKRYDQTDWKTPLEFLPVKFIPACGTVCCIAGWVDTLKNPNPVAASSDAIDEDVPEFAQNVLGLSQPQRWLLFDGHAAGPTTAGTLSHAKRGAAHIARFQQKYAAQLKAKRV